MRLFITVLFFLCFRFLFSQQALYTVSKHLNTTNGFPANTIYHIEFDKNGKSFIASDKGIIIYNGKNTQLLNKENGLPDNEVFNLKVKDSLLYFLPLKGNAYALNLYKPNYPYNEKIKTSQVLKHMLITDSLFYVCTYSKIFAKNQNAKTVSTLSFSWDIDIYLFNNTFYAKGNKYLLKFNLTKNTTDTININVKKWMPCVLIKTYIIHIKIIFHQKHKQSNN